MINLVKIKRGKTVNIEAMCLDRNGDIVTDLTSILSAYFVVKKRKKQPAWDIIVTHFHLIGQSVIYLNNPAPGWVKVYIKAADTEIDVGVYYMALQLAWIALPFPSKVYECRMLVEGIETDRLEIVQNIIQ